MDPTGYADTISRARAHGTGSHSLLQAVTLMHAEMAPMPDVVSDLKCSS